MGSRSGWAAIQLEDDSFKGCLFEFTRKLWSGNIHKSWDLQLKRISFEALYVWEDNSQSMSRSWTIHLACVSSWNIKLMQKPLRRLREAYLSILPWIKPTEQSKARKGCVCVCIKEYIHNWFFETYILMHTIVFQYFQINGMLAYF